MLLPSCRRWILLVACAQLCGLGAELAAAETQPAPATKFAERGVAFLKQHCLKCHGENKPKADLSLAPLKDEATLVRQRELGLKVLEMLESGQMPPQEPRPTLAEVQGFAALVRQVYDHADRTARPDPGKVTVRRLNRTEYNNTIRDLLGVDFQAAEDFPSDDVGHGFDNIGDVLTLSPVLMERYLAAAEGIAQRAILPDPPPPPKRHLSARYAEPAGREVPDRKYRPISTKPDGSAIETGPLFTSYMFQPRGEYIFRVRAFAEREGEQPVRIAVLACGRELTGGASDDEAATLSGAALNGLRPLKILHTTEITARDRESAQVVEVKLTAEPGQQRMAVALMKPAEDEPPATLYVEYLALEGPLDTRPESHRKIMLCMADKPRPEQTREIISRFASQAYRRPATTDEVERLARFVDAAVAEGENWEAGIQRAVQAVLVSPKFLFRVELDDRPDSSEPHPIDEYQLASRLSYFLWSSMPDEELSDLAARQQLAENLDAQVRRMLKDAKAQALIDNFFMQWLQLRRLKTFAPDKTLFPTYSDRLRDSMLKETELFLAEIIREDHSILDMIDADYTYLNETLSRHYGIGDITSDRSGYRGRRGRGGPLRNEQFQRVTLNNQERGGLLTQASVLTVTSNPTRTSPVKRGRWVLEQILGTPPPPPPPNVPELPEGDKAALTGSLRQRMEQHRANPSCANCHAKMDAIGFAFESYNAIGALRDKDGEFAIETGGTLPDGTAIEGVRDLKVLLKQKHELFGRCLAEKMLTYALGRGLEYYDRRAVDSILAGLAKEDYKLSTLVIEIARSDPFRLRRGKDPTP